MASAPVICPSEELAIVVKQKCIDLIEIKSEEIQASVSFGSVVEHVTWSPSGVYAVVADKLGGLNFVIKSGKTLFRQPLVQVTAESELQTFGGVQFVCPNDKGDFDELVVLAGDGKIFHFSNISSTLMDEAATSSDPSPILLKVKKGMVARMGASKNKSPSVGSCWISGTGCSDKTRLLIMHKLQSDNGEVESSFSIETWELAMDRNGTDQAPGNLSLISTSNFPVPTFDQSSLEQLSVQLFVSSDLSEIRDMAVVTSYGSKELEWWCSSEKADDAAWSLVTKWTCFEQETCLDVSVPYHKNMKAFEGFLGRNDNALAVLISDVTNKPCILLLRSELNHEKNCFLTLSERCRCPIPKFENTNSCRLQLVRSSNMSPFLFASCKYTKNEDEFCSFQNFEWDSLLSEMSSSPSGPFEPVQLNDECENEFVLSLHSAVAQFFIAVKENNDVADRAAGILVDEVELSLNQLISTPSLFLLGIRLLHDIVPISASFVLNSSVNNPPNSRMLDIATLQLLLKSSSSSALPFVAVVFSAVKEIVSKAVEQWNRSTSSDKETCIFFHELLNSIAKAELIMMTASKILLDESDRARDANQSADSDVVNRSSGVCHIGADVAWSLLTFNDPLYVASHCLKLRLISAAALVWRNHGVSHLLDFSTQQLSLSTDQPNSRSLLLIDNGSAVVDMLSSAPYDINPVFFSLWIEGEVIPMLTPGALGDVRSWSASRCRQLCVSHPSGHPSWAISLASAIDCGCQKYLGVSASADTNFVRWQEANGSELSCDRDANGTPRRSLMAHFDEMASSTSPTASISKRLSNSKTPVVTNQNMCAENGIRNGALWSNDELSILVMRLEELQQLWDVHGLEVPLKEYENISPEDVAFKLLDRAHSVLSSKGSNSISVGVASEHDTLMAHIEHHIVPFALSRGLNVVILLIDYTIKVSELMASRPPTHVARANLKLLSRQRRIARAAEELAARKKSKSILSTNSSVLNKIASGSQNGCLVKNTLSKFSEEGVDHDDLIIEAAAIALSDEHIRLSENGVAVLKCVAELLNKSEVSSSLGTSNVETCAKMGTAALSLLRTAVPPLAPGIKSLASDISHGKLSDWGLAWFGRGESGDSVGDELREAARLLRILEIVAQYKVSNFDPFDPLHASRLVNFLCVFHAPKSDSDDFKSGKNKVEDMEEAAAVAAGALDDALHICHAYSHLSDVTVVARYLLNLLQVRAISEEEFDYALSKLKKRDDALAVSDTILVYCTDGIHRLSKSSQSSHDLDAEFDRYTLTGLRVVAFWANNEAAQRIKDDQILKSGDISASVSGMDHQNEELGSSEGGVGGRSESYINPCFLVSGRRLLDHVSNVRISTKRLSNSSGPSGLVNEFNRIRSLHREFGLVFSLSSLHDKTCITDAMNGIVKNHISAIESQKLSSTVFGVKDQNEASDKKKGTSGAAAKKGKIGSRKVKKRGGNSEVLKTDSALETDNAFSMENSGGSGMETLRRAASLLNVPWASVAAEVAKSALGGNSSPFKSGEAKKSQNQNGSDASFGNNIKDALDICQDIWSSGTVAFRGSSSPSLTPEASSDKNVIKKGKVSNRSISESEIVAADAALALRDIATAFSRAIIKPSTSLKDASLIPLAAAEALRLLQRSVTICSREDLPRALDFLRSAEIVAAVLARTHGGEKFELHGAHSQLESSHLGLFPADGKEAKEVQAIEEYFKSMEPLHEWDRGDGLLLPPAETQALASAAALSELGDRQYLASFGKLPHSNKSSGDSPPPPASVLKGKMLSTPSGYNARTPVAAPVQSLSSHGAGATMELVDMLMKHGAAKLAFKITAGAVRTSYENDATNRLDTVLTTLAEASLVLAIPDFSLSFGAISALPKHLGVPTLNKMINGVIFGDRDYRKLEILGTLAIAVSMVWKQPSFVLHFKRRKAQAGWWRRLEVLEIPFDHKALTPKMQSNSAAPLNESEDGDTSSQYAAGLIPALLEQMSNEKNSLFEVRAFAQEFGVDAYIPDLLYVEHILKNRSKVIKLIDDNASIVSDHKLSFISPSSSFSGLKVDSFLLDCALFGNGKKETDLNQSVTRTDLVIRLLQGILKTSLLEIDYEGIEYNFEALIKALELKLDLLGKADVEQSVAEETEKEIQINEKKLETLSLLRGLDLKMPCKKNDEIDEVSLTDQRIPFFSLLEKPREVLIVVVNTGNIHKVNVLARVLGLRSGECYSLLLRNRFSVCLDRIKGVKSSHQAILPSQADINKWLKEITDLSLAVETAEWLSKQVVGHDKQSLLETAVELAQNWKNQSIQLGHLQDQSAADESLKRISLSLLTSTCETAIRRVNPLLLDEAVSNKYGVGDGSSSNSGTSKLKDLLSDPHSLLTELYSIASLVAARASLDYQYSFLFNYHERSDNSLVNSSETRHSCADLRKCSTIEGIHEFSKKILNAVHMIAEASSICSEMSSKPISVTMIRQKLVRDWLERPLSAGVSLSNSKTASLRKTQGNSLMNKTLSANSVVDDSKSVFRIPLRTLAELEDFELSLRVAVLLAPLPEQEQVNGKVSSTRNDALRILLDVAIGRLSSAKHSSRTHLRALRALSIIASPTEVNTLINSVAANGSMNGGVLKLSFDAFSASNASGTDKRLTSGNNQLGHIATQGSRLAQVAWLEELHLPTQGLLEGLGESLVRALWRDHNREEMLPPLLIDILICSTNASLSAPSSANQVQVFGDVDLWMALLNACISGGHWRELLVSLPRLGVALKTAKYCSQMAGQENGGNSFLSHEKTLVKLWDSVLRRPLVELEQRSSGSNHSPKTLSNAANTKAQEALPSLSSSLIFGSAAVAAASSTSVPVNSSSGSSEMEEFCGLNESSVLPVLEMIVTGLRTCPFLDQLDLTYFACAVAASTKYYSLGEGEGSTVVAVQSRIKLHQQIQALATKVASLAIGQNFRQEIEKKIYEVNSGQS